MLEAKLSQQQALAESVEARSLWLEARSQALAEQLSAESHRLDTAGMLQAAHETRIVALEKGSPQSQFEQLSSEHVTFAKAVTADLRRLRDRLGELLDECRLEADTCVAEGFGRVAAILHGRGGDKFPAGRANSPPPASPCRVGRRHELQERPTAEPIALVASPRGVSPYPEPLAEACEVPQPRADRCFEALEAKALEISTAIVNRLRHEVDAKGEVLRTELSEGHGAVASEAQGLRRELEGFACEFHDFMARMPDPERFDEVVQYLGQQVWPWKRSICQLSRSEATPRRRRGAAQQHALTSEASPAGFVPWLPTSPSPSPTFSSPPPGPIARPYSARTSSSRPAPVGTGLRAARELGADDMVLPNALH